MLRFIAIALISSLAIFASLGLVSMFHLFAFGKWCTLSALLTPVVMARSKYNFVMFASSILVAALVYQVFQYFPFVGVVPMIFQGLAQ